MKVLIESCEKAAFEVYDTFDASHDVDHIKRVMKNAEKICVTEPTVNVTVITLGVLLHDIDDPKYKPVHQRSAREILEENGAGKELIEEVLACIESVSFSGGNAREITSIEGAILRDADRLDAIGAVGIARAFAFGGARGRKLYAHDEEARGTMSEASYREKETATVTHFYEKLLLLKDLMVTREGKRLAEQRHQFMEGFLKQLAEEVGQ